VADTMSGAGLGFRRRDHNNSEAIAEILHPNEGYRCAAETALIADGRAGRWGSMADLSSVCVCVAGASEKLQRRGVTPKDYISENKRRVKQMQAKNREQRAKEVRAVAADVWRGGAFSRDAVLAEA
jgi:hypothetical protein